MTQQITSKNITPTQNPKRSKGKNIENKKKLLKQTHNSHDFSTQSLSGIAITQLGYLLGEASQIVAWIVSDSGKPLFCFSFCSFSFWLWFLSQIWIKLVLKVKVKVFAILKKQYLDFFGCLWMMLGSGILKKNKQTRFRSKIHWL